MSVKITLSCDGCHTETGPHYLPHREFRSVSGRGYGFGTWRHPTMDDVRFPEGWLYSDPYSGCTYCPACWAEIMADVALSDTEAQRQSTAPTTDEATK